LSQGAGRFAATSRSAPIFAARSGSPPPDYRANVNTTEVPCNRNAGEAPALTPDEIDRVVEFLNVLTAGCKP